MPFGDLFHRQPVDQGAGDPAFRPGEMEQGGQVLFAGSERVARVGHVQDDLTLAVDTGQGLRGVLSQRRQDDQRVRPVRMVQPHRLLPGLALPQAGHRGPQLRRVAWIPGAKSGAIHQQPGVPRQQALGGGVVVGHLVLPVQHHHAMHQLGQHRLQ